MKSLKKQYKDTFNNIKLDDKKINENLYKIIRTKHVKSYKKAFLSLFVMVLLIFTAGTIAYAINHNLESFEDKSDDRRSVFEYKQGKYEKVYNIVKIEETKKYTINDYENNTGIKLLKNKLVTEVEQTNHYNNAKELSGISIMYYSDSKNYLSTEDYNIIFFTASMNFDREKVEKIECGKNKDIIHFISDKKFETIILFDGRSNNVIFAYDNILYSFIYSSNKIHTDNITTEEKTKIINDIKEFVNSLNY